MRPEALRLPLLYKLIVAALQLKIALRMCAHRALDRRVLTDIDEPAVAALPDLLGLAGVDLACLNVGGQRFVALLVVLLNRGDHREQRGDLGKALRLRLGGHARVHRGVLLVLARGGHLQAGQRVGDLAVFPSTA